MVDEKNDPNNPGAPGSGPENYYSTPEDKYGASPEASDAPAVSAPAAKNFIFIGVLAIILIIVVYAFLKPSNDSGDKKPAKEAHFLPPTDTHSTQGIAPPQAIAVPDVPPPIQPIVETQNNGNNNLFPATDSAERVKRYHSEMLVSKGGIFGSDAGGKDDKTEINDNDPNTGFADSFFNQKDAPFAQARKLGDTSRLIVQGKIISSILETPINTDVPGMIRAIVSHDIYAESGRVILIPKGSRLVGTYNSFTIRGNKRVNVVWSRVIRPDGIDIMIRSQGSDQLGRAGLEADVDNKYLEIFSSAFLVSAINIAIGAGADAIEGTDKISTTTNTDGSTTTNTDAKQAAALRAIDVFGNAGQNLVDGFLNLKPTLTIDQGTRVNVFVNRDLIFPANLSGSVKYIK